MQETLDFPADELDIAPQRVCITAGGSSLGLAIARSFQERGSKVHIAEAEAKRLAEVLGELPGVHGTVADVSKPSDVKTCFDEALAWMGGLDVLVNCASISGPRAPLGAIDDDSWERTLGVNLSGAFYCLREASRVMREQRSGSIVNVASTAAKTGLPMRTAYVAAMSGLLGLTYNAARELGPDNVRCNAVLPGIVDDEQGRQLIKARARQERTSIEDAEVDLLRHSSMRTWIEPSEVADTVMFLCSDAARHISGQNLGVCGNLEWEG